jgi:hypothetical protein
MPNLGRRQQIRRDVQLQRRELARLAGIAQHSTMQALLAQAMRDLDDATTCLEDDEPRSPQDEGRWLQAVESMVVQAQWRLRMAGETISKRGPNAMLIQLT